MASDCIFCAIVEKRAPSETIYEDEHVIAFMDINPATDGHALVIPRAHVRDIWEIDQEEAAATMRAAVTVAEMIRSSLSPEGINMLHSTGAVAFQSVFHFHLHLVPRRRGDGIRLPWIPTPGDPERIAEVAALLRGVPTA